MKENKKKRSGSSSQALLSLFFSRQKEGRMNKREEEKECLSEPIFVQVKKKKEIDRNQSRAFSVPGQPLIAWYSGTKLCFLSNQGQLSHDCIHSSIHDHPSPSSSAATDIAFRFMNQAYTYPFLLPRVIIPSFPETYVPDGLQRQGCDATDGCDGWDGKSVQTTMAHGVELQNSDRDWLIDWYGCHVSRQTLSPPLFSIVEILFWTNREKDKAN